MRLTLSENITRLRKANSMTQERLAEALGVTFASVSKWERGVATPELSLIAQMADLFGVSLDALIGFEVRNNSANELAERIYALQREKQYEEAMAEAEKALLRFPNHFKVVYCCGWLYGAAGVERGEEKELQRSISLFEHSILLLSQNSDPEISEISIQNEIAKCHIVLGNTEKGIEILKKHNVCGVHNPLIALAYTGNDITYTNTPGLRLEDAVPFMSDAFGDLVTGACRTMMAYANYYYKIGDYAAGRDALLWLAQFLESIKLDGNAPSPLDKVIAPCYSECANLSLLLEEQEQAKSYLHRAYEVAKTFDDAPTNRFDNVKFCIGEQENTVAYDDLGESVLASIEKQLTREDRNPCLYRAWKQMVEENQIGGKS